MIRYNLEEISIKIIIWIQANLIIFFFSYIKRYRSPMENNIFETYMF